MTRRVLCLQGGGCLGKGQAVALAAVEALAGGPLCGSFDLILGCSVGAINGGCLAAGHGAAEINRFFDEDAPRIFAHDLFTVIGSINGSKYPPGVLEADLRAVVGDLALADCRTRFVALAFDCLRGKPVRFSSHEDSAEGPSAITIGRDSGVKLWEAMRASSAAQLYFPAFEWSSPTLRRRYVFRDGGNSALNAPDALGAIRARTLWPDDFAAGSVRLLSLGAGRPAWAWDYSPDPSALNAARETIAMVFPAAEDQSMALAAELIGQGYVRVDADLPADFAIDDASITTFAAEAKAWETAMYAFDPKVRGILA